MARRGGKLIGVKLTLIKSHLLAGALFLSLLVPASRVEACFDSIDPVYYAKSCPIIVTGKIVKVDVAQKILNDRNLVIDDKATRRSYDIAHIKVTSAHKVQLTDVSVKVGGEVLALMNSRKDKMHTSTDLRYPIHTEAIWLIYLAGDGEFYICERPEQRQRLQNVVWLNRSGAFRGDKGKKTKAQWTAESKKTEDAKRARFLENNARAKSAQRLFEQAFRMGQKDPKGFNAVLKAEKDLRERVLSLLKYRTGPNAEDRAALAEYLMRKDRDYTVRLHAMHYLKNQVKRPGVERAFYEEGLASRVPEVRARSCFVVWNKDNADLLPKVRALLNDKNKKVRIKAVKALAQADDHTSVGEIAKLLSDPDVRVVAITALGQLKGDLACKHLIQMLNTGDDTIKMCVVDSLAELADKRALQHVITLFKTRTSNDWNATRFAKAFGAMGDMNRSLEAAVQAMKSQHGGARKGALQAIEFNNAPEIVPLLMTHLVPEFRGSMKRNWYSTESFKLIWQHLQRLTDQKHGEDLVGWVQWWNTAHKNYKAPKLEVDLNEVAKLVEEMKAIRAARR